MLEFNLYFEDYDDNSNSDKDMQLGGQDDMYEGLPMPIMDNDFEDFTQDTEQSTPGQINTSEGSIDLNGVKAELSHLKLANMKAKKNGKGIDIRKGINIEKNMKMATD